MAARLPTLPTSSHRPLAAVGTAVASWRVTMPCRVAALARRALTLGVTMTAQAPIDAGVPVLLLTGLALPRAAAQEALAPAVAEWVEVGLAPRVAVPDSAAGFAMAAMPLLPAPPPVPLPPPLPTTPLPLR